MHRNHGALLVAMLLSTVLSAVLDAAPAGGALYGEFPGLALAVGALSFAHALELFAGTFALGACVMLAGLVHATRVGRGWAAASLPWIGAALAVGSVRAHLCTYAAFATFLPAQAGLVVLFVGTGVACAGPLGRGEPPASRAAERLAASTPWLALLGAVLAQVAVALLDVDEYPTLRLALAQSAHLLGVIGLWHAGRRWVPALARAARPLGLATLLAVALLGIGVRASGAADLGRPLFLSRTALGGTLVSLDLDRVESEHAGSQLQDDPGGVARFLSHAHMPTLPRDFKLLDYNVLWIMSEATRFDQTSFNKKRSAKLTPSLRGLRDSGAFLWTEAYSPSSGTFLSLSSLFGLGYPSMLPVQTWQKAWTGEFFNPKDGPASLFAQAGHHTFWISHNNASCFDKTVLGMHEGFQDVTLVKTNAATDRSIADAAIATLEGRAKQAQPFFGFVFFVSPHSPYQAFYPEMSTRTSRAVQRQEVRFMDEQLGRVLKALEASGLSERTIVVFASDHGEEFQEHGGSYHRATVYSESLHVPLLLRVPGVKGADIRAPTSLGYLWPWLLLRGSPKMRAVAEQRMRTQFGPMLLHTGGAVIAEVLGHDRMKTTLVYPRLKVNYDFRAQRTEIYDTARDPGEQRDLYLKAPELAQRADTAIEAYRAVRRARQRFTLRPDILDPRKAKSKRGAVGEPATPPPD